MEFLGIGYQEVLLVLVLMLVVVGPQRMPQVAYQIGRAVREMQKYARAVRDEFGEEWEYLDTQAKELRGEVDSASRDLAEVRRSLRAETDKMDQELKAASEDAQAALPAPKAANAGRTPSPLPARSDSAPRTARPAMISTNGKPAKPVTTLKRQEPAAEKTTQPVKPEAAEPKPEVKPADKPPLVF